MRFGIKILALLGLCGFVLSCLMGLAEDGSAPESQALDLFAQAPEQSEPVAQEPPRKYSRTRGPQEPKPEPFPVAPAEGLAPNEASQPFFPLGAELPPAADPAGEEELMRAQQQEPGFPAAEPSAIPGDLQPFPDPSAPLSEAATLFPSSPLPIPSGNVSAFDPTDAKPGTTSVHELPLEAAAPSVLTLPLSAIAVAPTTGPQTAMVSLEWVKRTEINVGQECQCDLVVKNTGDVMAGNVFVHVNVSASARILPKTTPAPTSEGRQLHWQLGELAPKQAKTIQLYLVPSSRGDLTTSAFVHFSSGAQAAFKVQEPLLEVALQGPKEVQLGDPASQIIQVSNPGTGTARNVQIKALIPDGLEHPQGKQLTMPIGSLNPGETRMVRLALSAVAGGKHQIKVLAEGRLEPKDAPYLRKVCESDISIIAPSVKVLMEGPGLRYKNRNATYSISVLNDGTADSNNVRVMHKIPDGFEFVSATNGGKFDALSKSVAWFVGRIEPGESSAMSVTLEAVQLGEFEHHVSAVTDQGARSEDRVPTKVEGIAALALEVKDLNDPVEIGVETAYEVQVKNQGTQFAKNVAVACELPQGVELVDVKAPCAHSQKGQLVVFQNLPKLDVDQTATFRIIVKGKADGYQRFRARLASDSIQEPLIVEELTKFYGE